MIQAIIPFVQQLLTFGGFRVGSFPAKAYRELLTAFGSLYFGSVVMVPALAEWAKACPGYLAIDDTSNPKYGLAGFARKMFITKTGGYCSGYRIVLFLWVVPGVCRIPLGFGMWHRQSGTLPQLALKGLSLLRNQYDLKPLGVLGDGGYSSDEILKRVSDYGWPLVMRFKNDRRLDGESIRRMIPRGYGQAEGHLKNGVKLKVIRRQKHFLCCNRMMWENRQIRGIYTLRWKVEEVFRALKTIIGLDGCQQHSMRAQVIYVLLCMMLFSCLEIVSGGLPYKLWQQVNFSLVKPESLLSQEVLTMF